MKEEFKVPYMILTREDIRIACGKEVGDKISDENMKRIAGRLGDILCSDWNEILIDLKYTRPEWFKVEK